MRSREAISLIDVLFEDSPVSRRQASGLTHTWINEVKQELEQSGVCVLDGLGTLSSGTNGLSFQADAGLNLMTELPAMEGYSSGTTKVNGQSDLDQNDSDSGPEGAIPSAVEAKAESEIENDAGLDQSVDPLDPEVHSTEVAELESNPMEESETAANDSTGESESDPIEEATVSEDDWDIRFSAAVEKADESISTEPEEAEDNPAEAAPTERALEPADDAAAFEGDSSQDDVSEFSPGYGHAASMNDPGEVETDSPSGGASTAPQSVSGEEITREPVIAPVKNEKAPKRRATGPSSRNSGGGKGAYIVLGVFAIAIVAALIYKYGFAGPDSESAQQAAVTEEVTSMDPASEDSLAASSVLPESDTEELSGSSGDDSVSEQALAQTSISSENDDNPVDSRENVTEDDSSGITRDMDGYTLITGSSLTQENAQTSIEAFRSLGLPVGVLSYQSEGVTRYRMGVGVFPTAALADSARQAMNSDLPSGTWVLRIQ